MLLLTLSFTPPFGSVELGLVVNYSNICVSLPSAVGTFLFVMREKKVVMEGESHSRVGWAEPIVQWQSWTSITLVGKTVFRLGTKKKNYNFPRRIEPQTFGFRAPMLYHWTTVTLWWAMQITKFSYDTVVYRSIATRNPKVWGSILHGISSHIFTEYPLHIFFTEVKTYHLSYYIYKHEAIDNADPSSMQDAC